jgi:3-oxoadipyl-CoA thiolase
MDQVYIVDGIRTPVGNYGGALSAVRPDDLAAHVIKFLLNRNPSINLAEIEQVIFGCANQAGEDNRNIARMAGLLSGIPFSVPGETVNILCASGMAAVINASRGILTGNGDLYVAGGVESMSRAPYVVSKSASPFGRDAKIFDTSIGWRFVNPEMKKLFGVDTMGETAENVAEKYNISRADQDLFAYHSQQKAAASRERGRFEIEIVPVPVKQRKKKEPVMVNNDEFIKPATSLEILQKLRPAFRENGSVTAGNSSGINDGAAAMLVASKSWVDSHNITPLASIVSSAVAGVEPKYMGIGPVPASKKALKRAGLSINDIDIIELNEAFAAQSLACIREFELKDDDPRINVNGGAIALGHPLGMSGTRLLLTAARELNIQKKRHALCTMCVGVGQGYAVILENKNL